MHLVRAGNVASESIEPRDVRRGCGLWFTEGAGGGPGVAWGGRVPDPREGKIELQS